MVYGIWQNIGQEVEGIEQEVECRMFKEAGRKERQEVEGSRQEVRSIEQEAEAREQEVAGEGRR